MNISDELMGFRFLPTDEEIISHFLKNKIDCRPDTNIREVDILQYEPSELPRQALYQSDPWWYFLSGLEPKYRNSKRVKRTTRTGYWKRTGKERPIRDQQNQEIGYKRSLVFNQGGGGSTATPTRANTNWIMTEYSSAMAQNNPKEYVVCCLTKKCVTKKRKNKVDDASPSNTPSQHSVLYCLYRRSGKVPMSLRTATTFVSRSSGLYPESESESDEPDEGWDDNFPFESMDQDEESSYSRDENETENQEISLLISSDESYSHNTLHTLQFYAPMSLKGVCAKDKSGPHNETFKVEMTAKNPLSQSSADSKDEQHMKSPKEPMEFRTNSEGVDDAIDNLCELVQDGLSINLTSFEAENSPKSENVTECESASGRLPLPETVTREKVKEAAKNDTAGSAEPEKSIVKIEEGK